MDKVKVFAIITYLILMMSFVIGIVGNECIELLYLSVLLICLSVLFGVITSIITVKEIVEFDKG